MVGALAGSPHLESNLVAINIDSPLLWLIPFVLAKGWLIMKYFMHIKDLLREGH